METRRNGPTIADGDKPASRCSRIKRIALPGVALIALLIALHLGLGGAIVASAEWSSLAIGIVGVVVLLKIGLVILGGFGIHRHRPAKAFRAHLSKGRA